MTQKDELIQQMRREAGTENFDMILALLISIPELKSVKKGKTLSFYKQNQIVATLRTHTLIGTKKFVLSVPTRLINVCPSALALAKTIWGNNPIENLNKNGNIESSYPMIISNETREAGRIIIHNVFSKYAEGGCENINS